MTLFCVLKNNSGIHKNKILKTRKTTRKSFRKFPNVNNSQTAPISGKSFPTSFTSTPPPLPQLIECVFPFAPLDLWQSTRTEGFFFFFFHFRFDFPYFFGWQMGRKIKYLLLSVGGKHWKYKDCRGWVPKLKKTVEGNKLGPWAAKWQLK